MAGLYGDISPRTAGAAMFPLLERAVPQMVAAKFGQVRNIGKNKTDTAKFRRYTAFAGDTPVTLVEGVTPAPGEFGSTDVNATVSQYGWHTKTTNKVVDTHEDPVLTELAENMGEIIGQWQETIVFNVLKAGTNVLYGGAGTSRATVDGAITTTVLGRVLRQLDRQNAKYINKMIKGSDTVGTVPIPATFIGLHHPDARTDLEGLTGFTQPQSYGSMTPVSDAESGAYKRIRFMQSTLYKPFLQAGASGTTLLSNGVSSASGAANADVYPTVVFGANAFATVGITGMENITPFVIQPKRSDSDPHAQRAKVGFDFWSVAVVLNDAWLVRTEHGVLN